MEDLAQLQVSRFSSDEIAAGDGFTVWRDSISVLFDVALPINAAPDGFHAELTAAHLGSLLFAETAATAQLFERSRRKVLADGIDHFMIQLYMEGEARARIGEVDRTIRVGDLFVVDLTQPSSFSCSSFRNLTLVIPRAELESLVPGIERLNGYLLPNDLPLVRLLKAHLVALRDVVPECPAAQAGRVAEAVRNLTVSCLASLGREAFGRVPEDKAAMTAAIRRFIEVRLGDPDLNTEAICTEFHLSRSYLYALFAPMGGVARYLLRRRLLRCLADLQRPAGPGSKIAEIAYSHGFVSESHFSRAFRKAFGLSPSEARRLPPGAVIRAPGYNHADYEEWVRAMSSRIPEDVRSRERRRLVNP